ncbi:phostensin-like isoform X1 [Conger conger]|uniref:phostensin-like isoform X1 n=1 Tax=Conger conger TaxID=82655 RepID=UPI002A59AB2B|nr:phostensin-like isoform X1 [Conger conger]
MSRIYKLKTVSSRTSASATEGKPGAQLLSLKIRQQEHHAQMHDSEAQQQQGQLRSQMFRIQLENQKLEMKLNQLCSQETREEAAANQPVQKQLRPFQLKEQNCNRTPQLIQFHQKIQQDHEPDNQMAQPKDEEICKTQKSVQPLQQHDDSQRTQSKLHQLNQSNFCTSFTINPKSSHSPENHPKNPGRSLTVPPPSASPSISPSQSPSLPLFSLRNSAAGLSKRGKTITINPRTLGTGMSSLPSPGVTGLPPSAPSPTPHVTEEKGKKRYPTVEEIEVIGGYQILEKSCLAKGSQKTVKVSFDEVQLEQLFEYPPESSLLASFLSPPRPGNETEERKEDEEDEDDEEEKEVFLLRSSRTVTPKFHLLKFSL